jgi:hypothetical protein
MRSNDQRRRTSWHHRGKDEIKHQSKTVYCGRHGGRKDGTLVDGEPVGMMKVRHDLLNYPNHPSIDLLLYS